jgi:glycosyltransferase involved in cell wall biosynthesis
MAEDIITDKIVFSIVIPVYNEEETILPLCQSVRRACEPLGKRYELIFVDDGSRDKTFEMLKRIHREDARV